MPKYLNTLGTISEMPKEGDGEPSSGSNVRDKAYSFFASTRDPLAFPDSYEKIWNKNNEKSNQKKIKALLLNYTNEDYQMGAFIGCVVTLHWNRNHLDAVSKVLANMSIPNYYESAEDIVADLKSIKFDRIGSLYQRIQFIEMKLDNQLKCSF